MQPKPRIPFKLALVLVLALFGWACGDSDNDTEGAFSYHVPWPKENGEYAPQNVVLHTISDPLDLKGSAAEISWGAQFSDSDGVSGGRALRYIEGDSAYIPVNFETSVVTAVYGHIERLAAMDRRLALGKLLPKPRKVGIHSKLRFEGADQDETNNAVYDGSTDSLIVVPYDLKKIPIAINAGILAHEHFHGLFNHLVLGDLTRDEKLLGGHLGNLIRQSKNMRSKRDTSDFRREFNGYIMRGLNEGLADFWGWVYSGDASFVSQSIPELEARRKLGGKFKAFRTLQDEKKKTKNLSFEKMIGESYKLGTNYARFLFQVANELGLTKTAKLREQMARRVLVTLAAFKKRTRQTWAKGYIEPNLWVRTFWESNEDLQPQICHLYKAAITDLASNADCEVQK